MHYHIKRLARTLAAAVLAMSMVSPSAVFAARQELAGKGGSSAPPASSAELPPSASEVAKVAALYGLTEAELNRRMGSDATLKIAHGRLVYQDKTPAQLGALGAEVGSTPGGSGAAAPSTADAFLLHSRPGARRVIYLDFDGQLLTGTVWNDSFNGGRDIAAPAWDFEGGASTFTETERARIIEIWQRVAEDYAGFDVDVTTQDPGAAAITRSSSTDEYFGTRVLVSAISSYVGAYGGYAYVGIFDSVGDYYKPALVFPERLYNNAKYIGEACSHESGHNVGLSHDGTTAGASYYGGHGSGDTSWAPIMGSGYSCVLTQWSRGEYPNANNKEDDLAVMQSNGLAYRLDDMGGSTLTARDLGANDTFVVDGVIEQNTDIDVMKFTTAGGTVFINITPALPGPDVDVLAELRNASGGLLAMSNPVDLLSGSMSVALSAGTYYLSVRGTGKGDLTTGYSSYGCIGGYTVKATGSNQVTQLPPIANATATPSSGAAPLSVQFSSALSSDADGQIVAWSWNFGDGTSSTVANPSHVYSVAGTYKAVLTVTDNTGLTNSASVSIVATAPNSGPVAQIVATPTSGTAPLAVQFSGTGSSDPDGTIVSYAWSFGDGTSASGQSVSHTYAAGSYTARLTVTDDKGATGSATVLVTAASAPSAFIRVDAIQLVTVAVKSSYQGRATVHVSTPAGVPVSGVGVTGAWSGVVTGTSMGTTDANGNVVVSSKTFRKSGTLTFTVTSLSKSGYTYDASKNVLASASMAATAKR